MEQQSVGKLIKRVIVALIITATVAFAAACSTVPQKSNTVRVTLMPSEYYEPIAGCETSVVVPCGQTVKFSVVVQEDCYIFGADYAGAVIQTTDGITEVSIVEPKYSVRVTLDCESVANDSILYDANGGRTASGGALFAERYVLNGHLRPNTAIGADKITRDGYTLIGWNTQLDGSGVHCGLGSRCDINADGMLTLYAEWEKQTDASRFEYIVTDGKCTITKCDLSGMDGDDIFDAEVVCVPEFIDGAAVTAIAKDAFYKANVKRVILPKSIVRVEDNAFRRSYIREFYMSDNIEYIDDDAFGGGYMPRLHINAVLPPRFTDYDRHSNYADKVDILRKYRNAKKIVLFGGSGTFFSFDSAMIESAFGGEYKVVNMGLNGWFSSVAQSDVILQYLNDGDILVHIPEMESKVQLFDDVDFAVKYDDNAAATLGTPYDDRFFRAIESNYDAISCVDFNYCPGVLDSFTRFNSYRRDLPSREYSANPDSINEYGDYKDEKPMHGVDESISGEAGLRTEYLTAEALDRLNELYAKAAAKGARVFVSYAAVNRHGLIACYEKDGINYLEQAEEFDEIMRENITAAKIIGGIEDSFFDGRYFFNTDWHLSDEGGKIYTERLINNLQSQLEGA